MLYEVITIRSWTVGVSGSDQASRRRSVRRGLARRVRPRRRAVSQSGKGRHGTERQEGGSGRLVRVGAIV